MRSLHIIFIILLVVSCKKIDNITDNVTKNPVADFNYQIEKIPAPCGVNFYNKSVNAISYLWDFGDGQTSTEQNPYHIFHTGGDFIITLSILGNDNKNYSKSQTITITKPTVFGIQQITVKQIPEFKPDGSTWDTAYNEEFGMVDVYGSPDIFITLKSGHSTIIRTETWQDITNSDLSNTPVFWLTLTDITDLNSDFTLSLNDDDVNNYDVMASFTFKPNDYSTGYNAYPTEITFSNNQTNILLSIKWE